MNPEPEPTMAAPAWGVLCRYAEIFLKGANRGFFERTLVENIRRVVRPVGGEVERLHGRVLVRPAPGLAGEGATPARLVAALQKTFGLTSVSPVRLVDKDLDAIMAASVAEVDAALIFGRPRSFKVEARRSDKRFQPPSPEIARQVGGAVIAAHGLPVDVHDPELTVGVEVGFEHAFTFARSVPGPGGLPVGCTGEVDLLLSGGIDSPVAGWMAMKRGCHIAATYFHSFPYTGDRTKDKVARLARKLAAWQGKVELRVVPFTEAQQFIANNCDRKLAVVLYRRLMMRIAERLAKARGALGLVTGESLAQVASQTLENLGVINSVVTLPVIRPLIAYDKRETITLAQRIDTYELSIEPYEDCCSLFVPDHPSTRTTHRVIDQAEKKLDIEAMIGKCLEGVETIVCEP